MIIMLVASSFLAGAALGMVVKIYSLVPAVLLVIALMAVIGRLEHLTTLNTLLASATAALACQAGYVVASRVRSRVLDRARPCERENKNVD